MDSTKNQRKSALSKCNCSVSCTLYVTTRLTSASYNLVQKLKIIIIHTPKTLKFIYFFFLLCTCAQFTKITPLKLIMHTAVKSLSFIVSNFEGSVLHWESISNRTEKLLATHTLMKPRPHYCCECNKQSEMSMEPDYFTL